jgi:hypothetical protein
MCLSSPIYPQDGGNGSDAQCSLVAVASVFGKFFISVSAWILSQRSYRRSGKTEMIFIIRGVTAKAVTHHS